MSFDIDHRPNTVFSAGLALLVTVILFVAATPGQAQLTDKVAAIDGERVTLSELEEFTAAALEGLERQRQKILEQGLGQLVDQRLLELEAKRRGIGFEELLEVEVAAAGGPVTEAEIDSWYEANKARVRQPKEAVATQIRAYLEHQRVQGARDGLVARLRGSHRVEIFLEPLRFELDLATAHRKGAASAPVTVALFSDFQCPACKRVNPILEEILGAYGDKVQLAFRQYPLVSIHPQAHKAAEAALCAGDQDKFWPMHDALFARQRELEPAQLKQRAAELGLDAQRFETCLDGGAHAQTVARDMAAGRDLGLASTPSLFVNGRPVDLTQGGSPEDLLKALVDDELRRCDEAC